MTMYKIQSETVKNKTTGASIPFDDLNSDYQQFIQDVAEQGIEIVEGPDVIEPDYATLRQQEYPPLEEQLDKIYHSGVTAWKSQIREIKERHPKTITGSTTIGDVPSWVQEKADQWMFNKQLRQYRSAIERLSEYILSEGLPEIREDIVLYTDKVLDENENYVEVDVTENHITQRSIAPLEEFVEINGESVRNPLIVRDEEERAAAQAIVDATPQSVIDSLNS